MRVKILRNVAKSDSLLEGAVLDLTDEEAADLIRRNLAEVAEPARAVPEPAVAAVPEPPAGSVERAERDLKDKVENFKRKQADGNV